jgi:2,4-dienoyl-CoA reductase (NADPH2)
VTIRGRILPNYACIDERYDQKKYLDFWRDVGTAVHQHGCMYIMQLSHSGRQQDLGGVENLNQRVLSSTNNRDPFHGILCKAMTTKQVKETIQLFADGARRACEAGLDGVELHGANGYLITQFLSSAINDREDEYGGKTAKERARFAVEIVQAIRKEVGKEFHVQMKISAADHDDVLNPLPWANRGNTLEDTKIICKELKEAGVVERSFLRTI